MANHMHRKCIQIFQQKRERESIIAVSLTTVSPLVASDHCWSTSAIQRLQLHRRQLAKPRFHSKRTQNFLTK